MSVGDLLVKKIKRLTILIGPYTYQLSPLMHPFRKLSHYRTFFTPAEWVTVALIAPIVAFIVVLGLGTFFVSSFLIRLLFAAVGGMLIFFYLIVYYPNRVVHFAETEIEERLQEAVPILIAQYKANHGRMKDAILHVASDPIYAPLSSIFYSAWDAMEGKNVQPKSAFELLTKATSVYIRRAAEILILNLEKGVDVSRDLQAIVEDMVEENKIRQQKRATVRMNTLLLWVMFGMIKPALYGLILSLLHMISQSTMFFEMNIDVPALMTWFILGFFIQVFFVSQILGELQRDSASEGVIYIPFLFATCVLSLWLGYISVGSISGPLI